MHIYMIGFTGKQPNPVVIYYSEPHLLRAAPKSVLLDLEQRCDACASTLYKATHVQLPVPRSLSLQHG